MTLVRCGIKFGQWDLASPTTRHSAARTHRQRKPRKMNYDDELLWLFTHRDTRIGNRHVGLMMMILLLLSTIDDRLATINHREMRRVEAQLLFFNTVETAS